MSNERVAVKNKNYKQLWAVALNASNEGVTTDQNLRAVMDCSIKRANNERIATNRKQLWTAASKE